MDTNVVSCSSYTEHEAWTHKIKLIKEDGVLSSADVVWIFIYIFHTWLFQIQYFELILGYDHAICWIMLPSGGHIWHYRSFQFYNAGTSAGWVMKDISLKQSTNLWFKGVCSPWWALKFKNNNTGASWTTCVSTPDLHTHHKYKFCSMWICKWKNHKIIWTVPQTKQINSLSEHLQLKKTQTHNEPASAPRNNFNN